MRAFLAGLCSAVLLVVLAVACGERSLQGPAPAATASLVVTPRVAAAPAGAAAALPINRIRLVAYAVAGEGLAALDTLVVAVDPALPSWTVNFDIEIPAGTTLDVLLTVELVNVTSGLETVEWSGRIGPLSVVAGGSATVNDAPVFRGPLSNLDITGIEIIGDSGGVLVEGDSVALRANVTGVDGGEVVFWSTLDATVATVTSTGRVRSLLPGTARIVATGGRHADTAAITVLQRAVGVVVAPPAANLVSIGEEVVLAGRVVDPRGGTVTGATVDFTVSDPNVVQHLGAGRIRAMANGTATITASMTGNPQIQATIPVSVAQVAAAVAISPAADTVAVGDTARFTATVRDANGNDVAGAVASWSSSDALVATVDASGLGRGLAVGAVTLTASSGTAAAGATLHVVAAGPGAPALVLAVAGDDQAAPVGTVARASPVARVADLAGTPVPGVAVDFVVTTGGGALAPPTAVLTDAAGLARAGAWTLGTIAGSNMVEARVSGLTPATFQAIGDPGPPAALAAVSGDRQSGNVGMLLPAPLVVRVSDSFGNAVPNVGVTWATTDGSLAPPTSTTDANGDAQSSWTLGTARANQVATATASGLPSASFTATGIFPTPVILLSLLDTGVVSVGRAARVSVQLSQPAGANGVLVSLASSNTTFFTVDSATLFVAQGATSSETTVRGVGTGTATLTATAAGHVDGSLAVRSELRVISMPGTLNVPFGQTASLPINLAVPAPAGGTPITITSSNPSAVGVQTATVTIPAGASTGNAVLQGVFPGAAIVRATSPSYDPDSTAVTTTANLNITTGNTTINVSFGTTILIRLESGGAAVPAPSPGIPVTVTAVNPGCVTAQTPRTIPTGLVDITSQITYAGAAPSLPCTSLLRVTAPDIAPDSITVTVNPTPGITLRGVTVGSGLQDNPSLTSVLGASNHGGVTVRVTSSDPAIALLSPNATTLGTAFIDIPVANGSSAFSYYMQGLEGVTGAVTLTASAPGFNSGSVGSTVVAPAIQLAGVTAATTTLSLDDPFQVQIGTANGQGTALGQVQAIRAGGTAVTATVTSSVPTVVELVTTPLRGASVTAQILPGQSATPGTVGAGGMAADPIAGGMTILRASAAGTVATSATIDTITVTQPGITLRGVTVGSGLQENPSLASVLGASNHGGVTVRVTSSDSTIALLSPNATTPGTGFIDIPMANGSTAFSFYVQGVEGRTGAVTLTASAPGFSNGSAASTVVASAIQLAGISGATTTLSPDDPFQVQIGTANGQNTALSQIQAIRAGGIALTATVRATNPAVAELVTTAARGGSVTANILPGQSSTPASVAAAGMAIDPIAGGVTLIQASMPGTVATTAANDTVTVTQPGITLRGGTTVGSGLIENPSLTSVLGASNHGGVTVRITSSDPALALLSVNATTAGTAFIDIPLANGATAFSYYLHGVEGATGVVTLTASAPGFSDGTATGTVVRPALQLSGVAATTTTLSGVDPFQAQIGTPNAQNTGLALAQPIRPGGTPVTVTFTNSAQSVSQLVTQAGPVGSPQLTIGVGQSITPSTLATGGVGLDPLTSGTTTVSATAPNFVITTAASVAQTVTTPGITVRSATVGAGLLDNPNLTSVLGAGNHGGVTVRVTSSNPAVALLSATSTAAGTPFIDIFIANNATVFTYYVHGLEGQTGTVTLTATAPGFSDGTTTATIVPASFEIIGLPTSFTAAAPDDLFNVRVGIPNALNTGLSVVQAVRIGGGFTATVTSSNASVGRLVTNSAQGASVTVQIAGGQSQSPSTLATGGVFFDALAAGVTNVSSSIAGLTGTANSTVAVTVSP